MNVVKDLFHYLLDRQDAPDKRNQPDLSYRYRPSDEMDDVLATPFADQFERMVSYVVARQDENNDAVMPFTTAILPMLSHWMQENQSRQSYTAFPTTPLDLRVPCTIPLAVPPFHSVAATAPAENETKVLEGDAAIVSSFVLDFLPLLSKLSVSHHSEINADVVKRWEMFLSQLFDELCTSHGLHQAPLLRRSFRSLTTLDVSYTSLGDDGVAYLSLILWPTEVLAPEEAVAAVPVAASAADGENAFHPDRLQGLPSLRVLQLDAVGMTARGFEALYRTLQNYSVRLAQHSIAAAEQVYLEHLSVAGNYINSKHALIGSQLLMAQPHSGQPLILGYNVSFNSIYNKNASGPNGLGELVMNQPVTEPVEELLQLNHRLRRKTGGGDCTWTEKRSESPGDSTSSVGSAFCNGCRVDEEALQRYTNRKNSEVARLSKIKMYMQGGNFAARAPKEYISVVLANTIKRGRPARLLALLASHSSGAPVPADAGTDSNPLEGSAAMPSPQAHCTMSPREFLFERNPSIVQQTFLKELCLPTFTRITCLDFSYNANIKDEAIVMLLSGIFAMEAASCCYADTAREHNLPTSTEVVKLVYHPLIFLEELLLRQVGSSASSLPVLVALLSVWESDETIEEMKERRFIPQTFYERRHNTRAAATSKKRNYFTLTPQRAMSELLRYINREAARELQKGDEADQVNKELNIQMRRMFEEVELFHRSMAEDANADAPSSGNGSSPLREKKIVFGHTFLLPHLRLLDLSENDLSVQMDPWQERSSYAAPSSVIAAFLCKAVTLAQQEHDVIQLDENRKTPTTTTTTTAASPDTTKGEAVEHFTLLLENCHLDDLTLLETAILYHEAMRVAPQVTTPVRAPPSFTLYLGHNKFTQDALVAFKTQTEDFFSYFIACSDPVASYVNGFVEGNFVFGPSAVAMPTPPPSAMPDMTETTSPDVLHRHGSLWLKDARVSWNVLLTEELFSGFRVPSHVTSLFPFNGEKCPPESDTSMANVYDTLYSTSPTTSGGSSSVWKAERGRKPAAQPVVPVPNVVLDQSLLSHLVEESTQLMSERRPSRHHQSHSDGDGIEEENEDSSPATSSGSNAETDMVALLRQPICSKTSRTVTPRMDKKDTE